MFYLKIVPFYFHVVVIFCHPVKEIFASELTWASIRPEIDSGYRIHFLKLFYQKTSNAELTLQLWSLFNVNNTKFLHLMSSSALT